MFSKLMLLGFCILSLNLVSGTSMKDVSHPEPRDINNSSRF